MKQLNYLNITNANIVEGGAAYYDINVTRENTIGYCMFRELNLSELYLPSSVTHVEGAAFLWCTSLHKIVLPNSLKVIESEVFAYCNNLTTINLPISLQKIGSCAFLNCPIETITIPENVEYIGYTAFGQCQNLKEIHIQSSPTTLTSIGSTLGDYEKITIYIPEGTKNMYMLTELGNFTTIIEE